MAIFHGFKTTLGRWLCNFLSYILPDRTKRLMLFASLAAYQDKSRFDKTTIHKLNKIMALSEQDQALNLPIHLSKVIWSGDRGSRVLYSMEQELGVISVEARVEQIIAEVPSWLKYRNVKGLREDLTRLLTNQSQLTAPA